MMNIMIKFTTGLLSIFLCITGSYPSVAFADSRVDRATYQNGQLKYVIPYNKNNQRHGLAKWYHENGQLWQEGRYEEGTAQGLWKKYNDDGKTYEERPQIDGQLHGMYKAYFASGAIKQEIPHVRDARHGLAKWYHENGKFTKAIFYVNGEEIDRDTSEAESLAEEEARRLRRKLREEIFAITGRETVNLDEAIQNEGNYMRHQEALREEKGKEIENIERYKKWINGQLKDELIKPNPTHEDDWKKLKDAIRYILSKTAPGKVVDKAFKAAEKFQEMLIERGLREDYKAMLDRVDPDLHRLLQEQTNLYDKVGERVGNAAALRKLKPLEKRYLEMVYLRAELYQRHLDRILKE